MEEVKGGTVDDKAIRYMDLSPSDPRRAVVSLTRVIAAATGRNFTFYHSTAKQQKKGIENGKYDPENNTIYIDINAGINETANILTEQVLPTISHELVHNFAVEDPEGFAQLSDLVFGGLRETTGKTRETLVKDELTRIRKKNSARLEGKSPETRRAIAEEEIVARACEDRLANSRLMKEFIAEMDRKDSTLAQKMSNILDTAITKIKTLFEKILSRVKSNSAEAKAIAKLTDRINAIQEQFDSLLEKRSKNTAIAAENTAKTPDQQKNTSDRGVMYMDRSGEKKSSDQLTEEDFRFLLEETQNGVFDDRTYIPMRATTPEFFIEVVREHSGGKYNVLQVPMAAKVEHVRQNMEEEDGRSYGSSRPHNLSVDDIVEISKGMGHPSYIVFQENKRYAMVVSFYNKENKRVVVSIAFAKDGENKKNYKYNQYMNGYNEGFYNIIVTQYQPDDFKRYIEKTEVVYDKKKMNGKYQVGSGRVVTFTHDTPFISDIIPESEESVKEKQLEIINKTNPAPNAFQTWIRKVEDIRTWEEVLNLDDESEGQFVWGDFSRADAEQALKDGTITVYSSYPIKNGVFVSTSFIQAEEYAGGRNGKVYTKTVPLTDVAWINGDEGQYAKVTTDEKGTMSADRDTYISARDLLLQAAEEAKKTKTGSRFLAEYENRVKSLDRKYERLENAESEYVKALNSGDTAAQEIYQKRIDALTSDIHTIESDLKKQEESRELKAIVKREKVKSDLTLPFVIELDLFDKFLEERQHIICPNATALFVGVLFVFGFAFPLRVIYKEGSDVEKSVCFFGKLINKILVDALPSFKILVLPVEGGNGDQKHLNAIAVKLIYDCFKIGLHII